jgi:hypothetical protein
MHINRCLEILNALRNSCLDVTGMRKDSFTKLFGVWFGPSDKVASPSYLLFMKQDEGRCESLIPHLRHVNFWAV